MSIQLQREKKAPSAPTLDASFARRLPLRLFDRRRQSHQPKKVGLSVLNKLGYERMLRHNGLEVLKALEQKVLTFCSWMFKCRRWMAWKQRGKFVSVGRPKATADHRHDRQRLNGRSREMAWKRMDDYISKPVRIVELQTALERVGAFEEADLGNQLLHRQRTAPEEALLDPTIIAELRDMPPTTG